MSTPEERVIKLTEGSKKARLSAARLASVQVLYQMKQNGQDAKEALQDFIDHRVGFELDGDVFVPADQELLTSIVLGVDKHRDNIEEMIDASLKSADREPVELLLHCILLSGLLEMIEHKKTDTALIIADYLNVTNAFYDKAQIRLIHGILDNIAKKVR